MAREIEIISITYSVSRSVLRESAVTLRSLSGGVRESAILWIGVSDDRNARVRGITVPKQFTSATHFKVPLEERLKLAQRLAYSREQLLVQLHTHPGEAFHSLADDRLALPRHTGALSIVVPNFADEWTGDLEEISINYHLGGGAWTELGPEVVSALFEVH